MRLRQLHLQNFRQHVDTRIEFRAGVTGVIGPNGAGKSTILEAIAWAIYGASAARGTNDTIRFSRAAPRARVTADLSFELDQHEYRIVRTLNSADVYLDGGAQPVATGVGVATSFVQARLGMSRQEFFNTYFTGQKELQFLAQMGPTDRGRFLAQVLGYERLRKAQEIAKGRRRELNAEIEGLKAGLPDPLTLKAEREQAEGRSTEAKKAVARIAKLVTKLERELAEIQPVWTQVQAHKERAQQLDIELASLGRELAAAQRAVERAAVDMHKVATAEQELAAIRPQLEELAAVTAAAEKQEDLSRAHARRGVLLQNEERLIAEIKHIDAALEGLIQAPQILIQTETELDELRAALPDAITLRDTLLSDWKQKEQDNVTQLRMLLDGEAELADQIRRLEGAGGAGKCPVCSKPLGGEYESVLAHLSEELEDRRRDIGWRQRQEKQLKTRPQPLVEAEQILSQLQTSIERRAEREAKCQQAVKDLWERTEEKQRKQKQLLELRDQLAGVPEEYDRDEHVRIRNRLAELQQFGRHASVYEHEIGQRAAREQESAAALARHAALTGRATSIRDELAALKFDADAYERTRAAVEKLTAEAHGAQIAAAEAKQGLAASAEAVAAAQRAEAAYAVKREKLDTLESDLRHHNEMDTALARLRTELNARVRPELAELASAFLSEITDGRYNALEIDESYNVMVLEDGEEKPVISGGEEDIANLVLRIAISQMIAERAGQRLSTLFLDEVFGSLDLERRDNVIQLLQNLHDRFEQVVLITHVETVREGLDHVIRLDYDERTGSSIVREDAFATDPALLV